MLAGSPRLWGLRVLCGWQTSTSVGSRGRLPRRGHHGGQPRQHEWRELRQGTEADGCQWQYEHWLLHTLCIRSPYYLRTSAAKVPCARRRLATRLYGKVSVACTKCLRGAHEIRACKVSHLVVLVRVLASLDCWSSPEACRRCWVWDSAFSDAQHANAIGRRKRACGGCIPRPTCEWGLPGGFRDWQGCHDSGNRYVP